MNNLKRTSLILLLFIVIMIIVSLFLPSSFHMERAIVIDADKEQIFNQVNDLKNWKKWSPWALKDELIYNDEGSFSSPSYGLGATFFWDSEVDDVGSGNIEIIESTPNKSIKNKVIYEHIESIGKWNFEDVENGVEVVWSMDVEFGFNPISKFFGLFMEGEISPDFELGLKRLKASSENLPKIKSVQVSKEKMEHDLWFLSIRDTVNPMEMNNVHGRIYAKISQYLSGLGIVNNESPLVIYHSWSDTLCDIEVGIPVQDSTIVGNDGIKMNKIKSTYVVTAIHYGSYDRMPETYFGINEWMRINKVRVTGANWEVYLVDPATEPNPEKWKTAIYFPIE
ncbi:MAG: hypothetical protein COA97_10085 [Flavobacteriales bacterium]|nr:MAG: hypothetical protein COA97_10085 [Flavobacteriales bacterium]